MGRAITYCVQCSKRVTDADLDTGKAFRIGDRILCKACAPVSAKVQTTKKVQRPKDQGTSSTLKALQAPSPPPAAPVPAPGAARKKLLLGGAGGVAVVMLAILLVQVLFRSSPPAALSLPPEPPTRAPSVPALPVEGKAASARADLDKARAFARAHPDDPAACMKEYNDILWKWEGTDAAGEAAKEAGALKTANLERVNAWMAPVEAQIKPFLEKGDLRGASRKMEEFKTAHRLLEWTQAVERRSSELRVQAVQAEDKAKSLEEPRPGAEAPKPVEKALSEEAKAYPMKWEAAIGRATARDFAGAVAELDRLAAAQKDPDVHDESAQDARDLRSLIAVYQASMETLKKKPRGSGLVLQSRLPSGETKKLGGLVLQIDLERVELQLPKGSAFVEWEEVASSTLADLGQASKADPRILAELCLLDGDVEAARAYPADLSPKWWTYAAKARSFLPKPDPGEKSARELYYSAERGFRSMETRVGAIESYRTLKTDFASTSLVKTYGDRIARRMEASKEYYFSPADFHAEGTFRLSKAGKLESIKDSDEPDTLRNIAEIEFAALAGVPYRCWLWVGACCEETFQFYLQGTEVSDTDPKTRKKIACDSGSTIASPMKNQIRGLKKTHAEHKPKGSKEHPKTAARWEWIEIPLPKYATPGPKRLRFMTNQAGFSIGGAVISSSRKAAPSDPELKDLDRDRDVPDALPMDPDLVAWWTFDEGEGARAADATGKGHDAKLVGAVQWVDGRIGGGVRFSAAGQALRVEDSEDLRIGGDLTIALWMKKEGEAGDWSCLLGKGEKQQRTYCLWLEANTRMILFQQYGAAAVGLKSTQPVVEGTWTHIAATAEGSKATLYINGVKDKDAPRGGPASVVPFPVGMGWACEHGTFRGVLDDVRLYRRALGPEEIRALVDQTR